MYSRRNLNKTVNRLTQLYRLCIKNEGEQMKDSRYYFLLGFMTAILVAMAISCTMTPLEAGASEIGSNAYNPLYVKIVD